MAFTIIRQKKAITSISSIGCKAESEVMENANGNN